MNEAPPSTSSLSHQRPRAGPAWALLNKVLATRRAHKGCQPPSRSCQQHSHHLGPSGPRETCPSSGPPHLMLAVLHRPRPTWPSQQAPHWLPSSQPWGLSLSSKPSSSLSASPALSPRVSPCQASSGASPHQASPAWPTCSWLFCSWLFCSVPALLALFSRLLLNLPSRFALSLSVRLLRLILGLLSIRVALWLRSGVCRRGGCVWANRRAAAGRALRTMDGLFGSFCSCPPRASWLLLALGSCNREHLSVCHVQAARSGAAAATACEKCMTCASGASAASNRR